MLCASRNVDAFQLTYLILLSGQASVEIRSESFQLTGICLLQFLFTCLKLLNPFVSSEEFLAQQPVVGSLAMHLRTDSLYGFRF